MKTKMAGDKANAGESVTQVLSMAAHAAAVYTLMMKKTTRTHLLRCLYPRTVAEGVAARSPADCSTVGLQGCESTGDDCGCR
jgi:hypothetical protein